MKPAEGRSRAGRRALSPPDALVMHDVRHFMASTAEELEQLLDSARALRRKLERTAEYRRAKALSGAGRESECNAVPAYDLAGTLEVMLEEDLENMVTYLRDGPLAAGSLPGRRRRREAGASSTRSRADLLARRDGAATGVSARDPRLGVSLWLGLPGPRLPYP